MPAVEAEEMLSENETGSYELAFHILPTIAEGEVPNIFEEIKAFITKHGGEVFDEEAPQRFELAYEIVKHLEGKNRKFTSAYFGWVRFRMEASPVEQLQEEMRSRGDILRYLLIKLTRVEEANPFRFHEAQKSVKMVSTINADELAAADDAAGQEIAQEQEGSEEEAAETEEKEEEAAA